MLNDRQDIVFTVFIKNPVKDFSAGELLNFVEVGRTTLYRDLITMQAQGLIISNQNSTRSRTYKLNPSSKEYIRWDLSRPPHQRIAVKFSPKLLNDYQPNRHFFLSKSQREVLMQAGGFMDKTPLETGKNYTRLISSLVIDLAHASSNLENVPISWLDTKTLLEFGERPQGLNEVELKIVLNHKKAINFLTEHALELTISPRNLFDLHKLIAEGLISDQQAIGRLRQRVVRFSDSRYLPPDNPHLLREMFEQFCEKAEAIENPFEQAFFIMVFLPYLQPFQDGNKRTSRLSMNIPLLKNHLAPFSFADLSKYEYMLGLLAFYERENYELLAEAFVKAYQKTAPRYAELLNYIQEGGSLGTLT